MQAGTENASIEAALDQWPPSKIFVAFNGGKDATVVLDLYSKALHRRHPQERARGVWFKSTEGEFHEVEQFVADTVEAFNMDFWVYDGSYQTKLQDFLRDAGATYAQSVLVLIGVRQSDKAPEFKHDIFMPIDSELSDPDHPGMRCHPILRWSYGQVWDYIVSQQLPVCPLYYQGYSSLGTPSNTFVNPSLKLGEIHPQDLQDWASERATRRAQPREAPQ